MDPLKRSMDMRMLRVKGRIARWMARLSTQASAQPRWATEPNRYRDVPAATAKGMREMGAGSTRKGKDQSLLPGQPTYVHALQSPQNLFLGVRLPRLHAS